MLREVMLREKSKEKVRKVKVVKKKLVQSYQRAAAVRVSAILNNIQH